MSYVICNIMNFASLADLVASVPQAPSLHFYGLHATTAYAPQNPLALLSQLYQPPLPPMSLFAFFSRLQSLRRHIKLPNPSLPPNVSCAIPPSRT
jgi:hypothetical protein